jgi:anti-sigma-K factor RskA
MRHWSHNAAALNELAGQYVLGTLHGGARRRFNTLLAQRADVAERVADWEVRLHRMAHALPPVPPRPALWEAVAKQAGLPAELAAPAISPAEAVPVPARASSPASAPVPQPAPVPRRAPAPTAELTLPQRLSRFLQALLAPMPAGALALGLMGGLLIPQMHEALNPPALGDTELPESYVGVLAAADGRPGLIVASRRYGRVVDLKQVKPVAVPAGQTLFLWTIDAQGRTTPVGPVPSGPFVQAPLADVAEKVFASAVELGVTLETVGSLPDATSANSPGAANAAMSGRWVFRGLCGKVWRVPPAAPKPVAG